jgi:4-amino-4-deoxy-L-arabinose transferase-like glycosyltransferase
VYARWLLLILLVAAALRLAALDQAPPGLNQDEAINAWDAWCLLRTGRDHAGAAWPVFYARALGENRTTLFLYLLLPFQALGGLNVWTLRLPVVLAGLATIALVHWIGARLWSREAGVAGAALLAVMPWHVHLSRWGHEGCLTALLTVLPIAALLWAGLPPLSPERAPRPWRSLLAGLLAGLCCYGYPAVRITLPFVLAAYAVATWRPWRARDAPRGPQRWTPPALFAAGLLATFGPLAWQHGFNAREINRRGEAIWAWSPQDSIAERAGKVFARYPGHFGPDFLFQNGDHYETAWASGFGLLGGFMAPLLAIGLVNVGRSAARSTGARILLAWLLAYPVGDCFSRHMSLHVLRAAAGAAPLALLAGVGLVDVMRWFPRTRMMGVCCAAACALALTAGEQTARFLHHYFLQRPREIAVYRSQHVDYVQACAALRGRLDEYDAVAFTLEESWALFSVVMVGLQYDPQRWHAEPREFVTRGLWDDYQRVGCLYFLEPGVRERLAAELESNGRADRVLWVLRPEEAGIGRRVGVIRNETGEAMLVMWEAEL